MALVTSLIQFVIGTRSPDEPNRSLAWAVTGAERQLQSRGWRPEFPHVQNDAQTRDLQSLACQTPGPLK